MSKNKTLNHEYHVPGAGTQNWHEELNENFERIDADMEIRDSGAPEENGYEPREGAKYLDTATGDVYFGSPEGWNREFAFGGGGGGQSAGRYLGDDGGERNFTGPAEWENDGVTDENEASGSSSVVAGGRLNEATGTEASVGGGSQNDATANHARVSGGRRNDATGIRSTVGGGEQNAASGIESTIGGGAYNEVTGLCGTIAGGGSADRLGRPTTSNRVYDDYGTVGGGGNNQAGVEDDGTDAEFATVAGGESNAALASHATVGGGGNNEASTVDSTVAGGLSNEASGSYSTVSGGRNGRATGTGTAVGGGEDNEASGFGSTVAGGRQNEAIGGGSTVGGGTENSATNGDGTVAGGSQNSAEASSSTIGGGRRNSTSSTAAFGTVAGGADNTATAFHSTVSGGENNTASGTRSVVIGGENNTASGFRSVVAGGVDNTASGDYSFAAGRKATANHRGSYVFADSLDTEAVSQSQNEARFQVQIVAEKGVDDQSARASKTNVQSVDAHAVLDGVHSLDISTWEYKDGDGNGTGRTHLGPMAEDFHDAFGIGNETTINSVDRGGVALAAIQGLSAKLTEKDERIEQLEDRLLTLEESLAELDA